MTTPLVARLVGGPCDGRLHATVANIFGGPPAAIVALATDGLSAAEAHQDARLRGMDMPHTELKVTRSNYFYVGESDGQDHPLYVHHGLNAWWGAPNPEEMPEEPQRPGGWRWVRYVGGALDGTLDRLPVLVTRWHDWRTTRVVDQYGVMIYLWTELGNWG